MNINKKYTYPISLLLFLSALTTNAYHKEASSKLPAINHKQEIVFGQTGSFTGSFKLYADIIKNAINAQFNAINDSGGIHNKKLKLISLNDDGDPIKAERNINLFKKNGVSMLLGTMGTRSILKVLPDIKSGAIAMLFPWSGDPQLKDPKLTNIINGPGLLEPQLKAIVDHIVNNIKQTKIAIFHADNDFSTNATKSLIQELKKHDIEPVITTAYNRHTLNITKHADKILETDPKIVISISTSMPTTRLINRFFEKGSYDTKFFGIDSTMFVGTIMKDVGAHFSYTSAVPDPLTSTASLAKEYRSNLKKYFPEDIPNVLSFSYYLSAAIIVDAIKSISDDLTADKIIKKIEAMNNYNLSGLTISFSPENRHAYGNNVSLIKG